MKPKVLIVDGHSMIFQWPDLTLAHARNTTIARTTLVRMLTGLQDNSDWNVVVVFDGSGPHAAESEEPSAVRVFYSKSGQTADDIIERLAARYASQYEVTVATDDHLERQTVEAFGASSMSAMQLREEIDSAGRDLDHRLRTLRKRERSWTRR
jgi:hypothetical protein